MIIVAVGIGLFIVIASHIVSPRHASKGKDVPYESGMVPKKDARERFNVRFCVIAILFLIFDVEVVFIFPWALFFRQGMEMFSPLLILGEIFIFIDVLLFGLIYAWKRGGLNWE